MEMLEDTPVMRKYLNRGGWDFWWDFVGKSLVFKAFLDAKSRFRIGKKYKKKGFCKKISVLRKFLR
jgi:hypothetical protein